MILSLFSDFFCNKDEVDNYSCNNQLSRFRGVLIRFTDVFCFGLDNKKTPVSKNQLVFRYHIMPANIYNWRMIK